MPVSAIDTCAIWNLFSSPRLLGGALTKGRWFVVASYVRYEAIEKRRSRPTAADLAMQQEFSSRLAKQRGFSGDSITVTDLAAVASMTESRKLGRGELAALALVRKLRAAIMTDDRAARKAAPIAGVACAHTTPQLLGWLLYEGVLTDGDVADVIAEHEGRVGENRGRLTAFFRRIHLEACRCRLLRDRPIEAA
jgi:hypothetical protein